MSNEIEKLAQVEIEEIKPDDYEGTKIRLAGTDRIED
jgi:hypothetical protein